MGAASVAAPPRWGSGGLRRAAKRKFHLAARLGYAAHGVVYALVGAFALDAAITGGAAEGGREAVARMGRGPLGAVLLTTLAAGLLLYSAMRFWQAATDPEDCGRGPGGLAIRFGHFVGGAIQVGLAFYALSLAFGWFAGSGGASGGEGGDEGARDLTARIMSYPGGLWAIGITGAIVVGVAVWHLRHAIRADFMDELEVGERSRRWVRPLGRAGFAARAIALAIIGGFLIFAALQADPDEARGLGGALQAVQQQMFGRLLLGAVALGLIAFAAMRWVQARCRAQVA